MILNYKHIFGEEKYHIRYKDMFGKEHSVEGDAASKSEAERLFYRKFEHCVIIKTQTSDEWINETAEDISNGLMKHIKSCFSGEKTIINPKKVKNINYSSKSFLKGLKKVNEEVEKSREMSTPNYEKKYLSYNI
jgi:hypothetical protein